MMRYCKDLTKKIINSPKILKFLFGFFSYVHGKCYMALSVIAILQNKGVHPKHRILNYHKFFLDHVESSDTVLDIGCSHGNNAFDVAQKAKEELDQSGWKFREYSIQFGEIWGVLCPKD